MPPTSPHQGKGKNALVWAGLIVPTNHSEIDAAEEAEPEEVRILIITVQPRADKLGRQNCPEGAASARV